MKIKLNILLILLALLLSSHVSALEITDNQGGFKSKLMDGRMYDDRGKYIGMITKRGRMYDKDGHFIGQVRGQNILNADGTSRGFIRDGKIYGPNGEYRGQVKH